MTRSEVEKLWGSPAQEVEKVFSDGNLIYCWYYDSGNNYRWIIYNDNNVVVEVFGDSLLRGNE